MNKCINCGYFLNCSRASEEIIHCEQFMKRSVEIIHDNSNENEKLGKNKG